MVNGKILSDTNPYEVEKEKHKQPVHKNLGKTSMSFLTSLSLSFNNLRTKKGRTILTSFAGSIGIIGIALILSLSNGVNTYIKSVEEDTLSEYPLQIQSSGVDISSILMGTSSEANYEETSKKWRRFKNSWNYTAKRRGNKYYANVWNILSSIFNRTCN